MSTINPGMNLQNTQVQADKKTSAIVKNSDSEISTTDKFQASSGQDTKLDTSTKDKFYGALITAGLAVAVGAPLIAVGAVGAGMGVGAASLLGLGTAAKVVCGCLGGVTGAAVGFGAAAAKLMTGFLDAWGNK